MGMVKAASRRRLVPATEPVPGRPEMVTNSTGGYGWQITPFERFNRFLILGSEGGSYYASEQKLTAENTANAQAVIKADGVKAVGRIVEVSTRGLAYRVDPAIYALALAACSTDAKVQDAVRAAVPKVCRTGTHLLHFVNYANSLRGWGRTLRRSVGAWYTEQEVDALAFQMAKYAQRDGFSHGDVLRLVHPRTAEPARHALFRWALGADFGKRVVSAKGREDRAYKAVRRSSLPAIVAAFDEAKAAKTAKEIVRLIEEHRLPREAVPTELLNDPEVWEALLEHMPLTAMIRNLGKMTAVGLIKPLSSASKLVSDRLGNATYLRKSRIHPLAVLVALRVYDNGHGVKGSLTWSPVPAISSALDGAFYATFHNVVPTGKNLLVALDVSGSMGSSAAGATPLRACEVTAAMSLVFLKTEPNVHVFGFANTFRELGVRKGMTLGEAQAKVVQSNFGSTNIGLAVQYAIDHKLDVGGFVTMTDNEVNGGAHLSQLLQKYRRERQPEARSVIMATTSTGFTVHDPQDKFCLDVAGFDPSVPAVIADFVRELGAGRPEVVDESSSED